MTRAFRPAAAVAFALCVGAGCAATPQSQPQSQPSSAARPASAADRYVPPQMRPGSCIEHDGLPDRACTPGATDARVTSANIDRTICVSGYTKTVRPPVSITSAIKRERMSAYGATGSPSEYELDHLIPLELGGAPADVANLWPEPLQGRDGATSKDEVENALHRAVCAHRLALADAQRAIATNWRTAPAG